MKANFDEWQKDNEHVEVYCIYDSNGNELFDVVESDFIKMVEDDFLDCDTRQLHADLTESDIEAVCAKYGILWTE